MVKNAAAPKVELQKDVIDDLTNTITGLTQEVEQLRASNNSLFEQYQRTALELQCNKDKLTEVANEAMNFRIEASRLNIQIRAMMSEPQAQGTQ